MKKLTSADCCMLICAGAMLACISDILAVHFGAAQEAIRANALAGADLIGIVWAASGILHRTR
jgi:hypothetical protein